VSQWPVVTVGVNTYNRADLLPRALDSVLVQELPEWKDFEVIVADDCSNDAGATDEVIKRYARIFDDRGIVFTAFKLGENSGYQCVPKNKIIELAHGDFIRYLDDDNAFTPGSLKALVDAAHESDVWSDVIYGRRTYIADDGFKQPEKPVYMGDSPFVGHDPERLAAGPMYNYIDTSDALIARGAFWWLYEHTNKFWDESYRRFGDWELFTRMANLDRLVGAASPRFKALDQIVSEYHWTGTNLQLTRPLNETPVAKSMTSGQVI